MKSDPPLPELPARYKPVELLGEGATGSVYLAHDHGLGVDVAVKVVRPNLALHARFRAHFSREVATGARIVHPRVVPVHDAGRLPDGRPFVALAYADRGSLGDRLRTGLPLRELLRLLDQVLAALAAIHARGLLHQDLKPENVLLHSTPEGQEDAWVADLGVAGALAELARNRKSISGTPAWMAPEQLMGQSQELGPWTDLYAIGLMLDDALTGQTVPPAGRRALLETRLDAPMPARDGLPPALAEVISVLLDPDPRQRFDRAADVRRELAMIIDQLDSLTASRGLIHNSVAPGMTSFHPSFLPEAVETVTMTRREGPPQMGAPSWHRVPPDKLPPRPPPEWGHRAPARASQALFALREPPLIGREEIRNELWRQAGRVIDDGQPRVILVIGEAGSGKSRIVESVAQTLDEGGYMEAFTLRYQVPAGVDDGYRGAVREILSPWNENRSEAVARLRRWLARDRQVDREAVGREVEVLARWCGYLEDDDEPVNAAVGLAFLYRHLDARAWRGGACLVLEDAHLSQAEGDGLAICEALLERSVGERPVLAMVTLASEAVSTDKALRAKVDALVARGATRISAPRLTEQQTRALLRDGLQLSPELAEEILPRCQGSPSLAVLFVRELAVRGALVQGDGLRYSLSPELRPSDELPSDEAALCEQRVAGAVRAAEDPSAAAEALAAMALAGREPPAEVVRSINAEGVDALIATGLIHQRGWRLVFEHGGVQRAARRVAQRRADRLELHGRLASAWERVGLRTGAAVDLPLGLHRLHSGQAAEAAPHLARAARTLLAEGRSGLAEDAARLAVAAADRVGSLMGRVDARCQHAETLLAQERPADARQVLSAARGLGHLDRNSNARIQVILARAAVAEGRLADGTKLLASAEATFEATQDRQGLIDTAHGLGALHQIQGRPDEAAASFQRILKMNRGDRRTEVNALFGMIQARISAGRLRDIDRHVDRLRRIARESGDTRNIAQATYVAGMVHLRRMRLEQAERHFRTARALAATLGADRLHLACQNNLGEVYRYRGDTRSAESCYRWTARFAEERSWSIIAAVARLDLALLAMLKGAGRLAAVELDRAAGWLADNPDHWAWQIVGLLRAVRAAEEFDEPNCRAWWSVAIDHGLGRMQSPDLWLPLERLATAASQNGWDDLASKASDMARMMTKESSAGASLQIEEE